MPYLKTKAAMARPPRRPFGGLTTAQSNAKLELLYSVIDKYVFFEVSSVIELGSLRRIFLTSEFGPEAANPFYHGLMALIDGVIRRQIECGMEEKIDFIFDEKTEKRRLLSIWDTVIKDGPDYFRSMVGGTPVFKTDTGPDGVRPLQAADLEAWWLRRRWREKLLGTPRLEYPWRPTSIPGVSSHMGEEELKTVHEKMVKMKDKLVLLKLD